MIFEDDETLASHPGTDSALASEERRMSLLIYHRNGVEVVPLLTDRPITIGRLPPSDIVIGDDSLSRRHALVELLEDEVWIEDLKSTNGTRINGKTIKRARMKITDEVMAGYVTISLHVMTPMEGQLHGLDSNDRFHTLLEEEIARAQTFGRKLALIMVRASPRNKGKLSQWCPRIRQLLRRVDRMGLYSPDVVEILLPEVDLQQATQVTQSIVTGRRPIEPPLLCGVAIYPDAGSSAEELIEVCRTAMKRATLKHPIHALGLTDPSSSALLVAPQHDQASGPVFYSPSMLEINSMVERLAASTIPVLILGETGSGKEVIARAIHQRSNRRDKPLRCINCGAIPEHLIESVLFGHERGAFTGADRRFHGAFEEAEGGSVFLDEIGEISLHSQVALLRVLDTKQITRVGSNDEIKVDVRILAATHQDLQGMCQMGTFRSDLFYRLNTMVLKVPPLRERTEEIQSLAELFIQNANAADNCNVQGLEPAALTMLQRYHWPGNVRELRNVIDRAVVISRGKLISVDDLPERLHHPIQPTQPRPTHRTKEVTTLTSLEELEKKRIVKRDAEPGDQPEIDFKNHVQRFEISLIREALLQANGNQTQAAQILGIARRTLIYKINDYGIDRHPAGDAETTANFMEAWLEDHSPQNLNLKSCLERFETKLIKKALQRTGGNLTKASQLLGLPKYTVTTKANKYGLK